MAKDIEVPTGRYMLEVVVAAPGTALPNGSDSSLTGHMFYVLHAGPASRSYGFQPSSDGEGGDVSSKDKQAYADPFYTRQMEITKQQHEALQEFGMKPEAFGFKKDYDPLTNNCAEFTWSALNHAGLHAVFDHLPGKVNFPIPNFNGSLKPLDNIDHIRSIAPPIPNSELNQEIHNPMPERDFLQWLLSDQQKPPLLQQAFDAVSRRDADLGRPSDEASQKIAVAGASLAARNGYARIDDIVFNTATDQRAAGERFFVLQGGRDDPAHLRESMLTRDALALSPEQMKQQTSQLEMAQARTQEAPVQEHASRMPSPAGPHLG